MPGYDQKSGKITDSEGGLTLVGPKGEEAAPWHYADMMRHWNRKHARAVYVPSMGEIEPQRRYKYGNLVEHLTSHYPPPIFSLDTSMDTC